MGDPRGKLLGRTGTVSLLLRNSSSMPYCVRWPVLEPLDGAVGILRDVNTGRMPRAQRRRTPHDAPRAPRLRPVGVALIGDLAIERDAGSALADISSAAANA